ncbi:MAG: hypothetical protein O2973_09355 [Gemmatimonadetes bacterium]|nr:hypothetical protein [Gemmatimonadota bacterium]
MIAFRAQVTNRAAAFVVFAFAALGAVAPAGTARAQGPRGAGPDARTPAAGTLRAGFGATWTRNAERYEDGIVRELGARFSFAAVGADVVRSLGPVEEATRVAAGSPTFLASLGSLATQARSRFESTPISAEYGITNRFAVGVIVPFATSISRVDVVANGVDGSATLGLNPALVSTSIVDANGLLLTQMDAAATFLSQRITTCGAAPGTPGCGAIVASTASAQALLTESGAFTAALAALYGGRAGSTGALFVPLAGSAAQAAIAARLTAMKAQFGAFGAPAIVAGAPVGAPAPLTGAEFQRVIADSTYGIIAAPLASVVRRGVGDVDFSAQYTWHDSYAPPRADAGFVDRLWWRSALIGVFRLGSGAAAEADDLIPVAIGQHQNDIELRSITDVGLGVHFSITTALRYTRQNATELSVRVPAMPQDAFPEAFRTVTAALDLGDELALELFPRWSLSEAMSVAAYYGFRRKAEDSWSGTATAIGPDGGSVSLDAGVLSAETGEREHRFGTSIAYSTLSAWERGGARWPLEISFSHFQTSAGTGGYVPKVTHDAVQIRWYWSPFGGGPRRQ